MTTPTTKRAIHSARALELLPPPDYSHLEPLPDPPREPDMLQDDILFYFKGALKIYYAGRGVIVLIVGQGYLRREPYNADERFAPDCVVVFGVNPKNIIARNGYVISEVGKPPDFVLEVASEIHRTPRLHCEARGLRPLRRWRVLAIRPLRGPLPRRAAGRRPSCRGRIPGLSRYTENPTA